MKIKITLLLMALFLGTGSMMAENMRAYSLGMTNLMSNAEYTDGKLYWKGSNSNGMTVMQFTAGTLSKFSKLVITTSDYTNSWRIVLHDGSNNIWTNEYYSAGEKILDFSSSDFTSKLTSGKTIADVTSIRILGSSSGSFSESSKGSITISADNIFLESSKEGISSATDWTELSEIVNAGLTKVNVAMTGDITISDGTMVGLSWDKSYKGIFDGTGHTLTFNYSTSGQERIAPFKYIEGATIKNLKTTGSIETDNFIAGIAADVKGTNNITCCGSDMILTASNSSDCRVGGLVARCNETGATIVFDYCLYNGAISAGQSERANGFVGYVGQPITVKNSLLAPTSVNNGGNNFGNYNASSTYTNSYYATKFGNSGQGTDATATDYFVSGSVAYALNEGNTGTLFFGQAKLNTSISALIPELTTDESKKVIKLTMSNASAAEYANKDGAMPSPVDKKALSFWNGSSGNPYTSLSADATISRNFEKYPLTVSSAGATTLVLPVNIGTLPEGVKAYDLSYTSGDKVTATEVTSITANKPVLINAAAGTYIFESNNSSEITYDTENAQENGALYGVYTDTYKFVPANSYVLQNKSGVLGFYQVQNDNTVRITSFRAYLTAQGGSSAPARLNITFDYNNTTGIKNISEQTNNDDAIYTLNGTRVDHPVKGLYIKNGKKFIVK